MKDNNEHKPGTRAPRTAYYEELNASGTLTGVVSHVEANELFPFAPHRHRWRLRPQSPGPSENRANTIRDGDMPPMLA